MILLFVISVFAFEFALSSPGPAPLLLLNDGHKIPQLGLGTWLGASDKGLRVPEGDEVEHAVEWAIDAGYRHIDTAPIYDTEDQVGRAVENKIQEGTVSRDDLFITTKLWNDKHAAGDVLPALRDSLRKLSLDYVDLYLIHWPIGQHKNGTYYDVDLLETWQAMVEARSQGLARSVGVSNFNQAQLERIINNHTVKPAVLQVEINLNLQQPELLAYCKRKGVQVTGYTPFGSLFRSKAKPDAPPPRIDDPALLALAGKYNKTAAQINLRYLLDLGVTPIPKSITKSRIEDNINVFDFQLTDEEKRTLKEFDKNYRTIAPSFWKDSPQYPF